MADNSVPPDPWTDAPGEWEPPPLRYPKGLENLKRPDVEETSRMRRKPRQPSGKRSTESNKAKDVEEWSILDQLRLFARDTSFEPYYRGVSLPGEGSHRSLKFMRRVRAQADEPSSPSGIEKL